MFFLFANTKLRIALISSALHRGFQGLPLRTQYALWMILALIIIVALIAFITSGLNAAWQQSSEVTGPLQQSPVIFS